jgi:hypothetical protein
MQIPSQPNTDSCRPFLPAKDFDLSKLFYEALGFFKELDGDVAIFRVGSTSFILQNRFERQWAENSMMQLMVDDLYAWWERIESLDLSQKFGVPLPRKPEMQPWGLRIGYIVDPSGVLWHVGQRREGVVHDR